MEINTTKTVRELTLEIPGAARVFESMGIDYCCGGGKAFQEACAAAGLSTDEVVQSLEQARQSNIPGEESTDWQTQPLSRFTSYIVSKHHTTLLFAAGENAKVVSERLGHSSTAFTQDTYVHVLPSMQRAATSRLEGILGKR
jgi:iron-sulfur cluster repair protein YtfE (RIC family)